MNKNDIYYDENIGDPLKWLIRSAYKNEIYFNQVIDQGFFKKNSKEELDLYCKAAINGNTLAQVKMGDFYYSKIKICDENHSICNIKLDCENYNLDETRKH